MKVPLGMNNNFIGINHLSNYLLEKLVNGEISEKQRQLLQSYKISLRKARIEAWKVLAHRRI